ncbi:MAG: hypothetical protein PW845_19930 [Pseudomonas sp.]|uniref:hypothetical protein n=1 Tax=Pseudomonas abieticivorans TaxID=2931382 RepID=UPI0020BD9273|nr:hypothetical protein [Pseudomonas sp. PIA16]MDE1167575.1 hypothetical protein [Pseudomonas sp.]
MNNRFNPIATFTSPGAESAYLRANGSSSHIHFKRLRASVSAKQNGFWQIIN